MQSLSGLVRGCFSFTSERGATAEDGLDGPLLQVKFSMQGEGSCNKQKVVQLNTQ